MKLASHRRFARVAILALAIGLPAVGNAQSSEGEQAGGESVQPLTVEVHRDLARPSTQTAETVPANPIDYGGVWVLRGAIGLGLSGGVGAYGSGVATGEGYISAAFGGSFTISREINEHWSLQATIFGSTWYGGATINDGDTQIDGVSVRMLGVGPGFTYHNRDSGLFASVVLGGGRRRLHDSSWFDSVFTSVQPGLAAEVEAGILVGAPRAFRHGASISARFFSSVGEDDQEIAYAVLVNYVIEIR